MSSRSTSLEPKSQLTINLDLGWEFPSSPSEEKKGKRKFPIKDRKKTKKEKKVSDQRLEEKQKKKRRFPIKDRKRTKENIQKGLQTRKYLNNTELSQANKKRKETTTWSGLLSLITNQNLVCRWLFRPALNKNKKGKGPNTQSQISHQEHYSQKSHIDPWSCM